MQQLLEQAIAIALLNHSGRTDKGGNPYILHPLRVMMHMDTIEEQIIAVLHDVIEDTDITIDYLVNSGFPASILRAIDLLTKKQNQSYPAYILAIRESPITIKVKLADLKDNLDQTRLKEITNADRLRIRKYKQAIKTLENGN